MLERVRELSELKNYIELKKYLTTLDPADIAIFISELSSEEFVIVYRLLPKDIASEVFVELESDLQEKLINLFTDKELKEVLEELFLDDTADLIEEMPANVVRRIVKNISKKDRKIVNELLKYPEDSAGSIMTPEFIDFKVNMTMEEAFENLRKVGADKANVYTGYVLTASRKILGKIDVKDMILADKDQSLKDIMDDNIITVNTLEDQEEVVKKFQKYDLIDLPVVDNENRLVGIITVDDAIDVMQEEAEEDFEKMAAMSPSEDGYFKTTVFSHAKNRMLWLLLLMISSAVTGAIITKYEMAFEALPILVSFIPMIMGTGGNCGSQASTLIIRGLATDEVRLKDIGKVIWKELRISVLVGIILAIVNGIRIMIQYQDMSLAIIVGITLIITAVMSKLIGGMLPIIAKKFKLDPAIMAAPIITTIVDCCSVFAFFNIALIFIS